MVRLKDAMIHSISVINQYISIPYGAIKSSNDADVLKLFTAISIPYGAIKSW